MHAYLDEFVILICLSQLLIDVLDNQSDHPDDGNDQGAKGQSPQMVTEGSEKKRRKN